MANTSLSACASWCTASSLVLNNWVWLLDKGGLYNWDDLLSVDWVLNVDSLDSITVNWFVNLHNSGVSWADLFLDDHIFLDVVWNILLHIHWNLDWHLNWHVNWNSHLLANWYSLRDLDDVGHLAVFWHWNLFYDTFV